MLWRYLLLSFLLGAPSSRILTSAALEQDGSNFVPSDDIIETIVRSLEEQKQRDKLRELNNYLPPEPVDKKESSGTPVSNSNPSPNEVNLQSESPSDPPNPAPPASLGDGQQGQDQSGTSDTDTGNDVVHHKAGKTAALQYNPGPSQSNREDRLFETNDKNFMIVICVVFSVGFIGLMAAGVCYYKYRRSVKAASDVEYPAYGVTGPMKERIPSPGDRKLAQSAQMYHYQHQKQQMIAMEKANGDMKHDASDDDSEEDNVEGDYTVYECPGLAPTGEMEVKNPLFRGGDAPVSASPPREQHDSEGHGQQTDQPPPYRKESQ